jgi:hypothetical protein
MFAGTFMLSLRIKVETYQYESLADVQRLILEKFAGKHGLFASMCTIILDEKALSLANLRLNN